MSVSQQTLTEINNMINKDLECVERRKLSELTVGKVYLIKKICFVTTRYGKGIVVALYDRTHNVTFESFLPKRVAETMSNEAVESMNKSSDRYTLTYLGQSSHVYSSGNTRTLFNFGVLE